MKKIKRINFGRFLRTAMMFLVLFTAGSLFSQIEPNERRILELIASYTSENNGNLVNHNLLKFGFFPEVHLPAESTVPSWDQYPTVRKLEAAFLSAEKHQKGYGNNLLKAISHELCQNYGSAKADNLLSATAKGWRGVLDESKINFKALETVDNLPKPPPEVRRIILRISRYTDQGALNGPLGVLRDYFQIADDELYDILRSSKNSFEAIQKGYLRTSIPPAKTEQLLSITDVLEKNYESFRKKLPINKAKLLDEERLFLNETRKKLYPSNTISISSQKKSAFVKRVPDFVLKNNRIKSLTDLSILKRPNTTVFLQYNNVVKFPYTTNRLLVDILEDAAKSSSQFLKTAAIVVALGVTIYAIYDYFDDEENTVAEMPVVPMPPIDLSKFSSYIYTSQKDLRPPLDDYLVLISSDQDKETAEQKLLEAIDRGFKKARVGVFNCKRWYSVVVDSYATKDEAQKYADSLKASGVYKDAYVNPKEEQVSPCPD